jgi:glycosyltransferase involved in cell wall biosynthesis
VLPLGAGEDRQASLLRSLLDTLLAGRDIAVAWYYTPMALEFSGHLVADRTVYDCMDELSAFRGAPPRLVANEKKLLARADLVFTGGRSLYEAKRRLHPAVHAFPSSVDKAHFGRARAGGIADPEPQAAIPHPRVGFFGVIDERLDVELVAGVAALRPELQFILLGPVVKIDPATLPQRPNLHWLGGQDYKRLPDFLGNWDAGFMPFALNESTRFISPTKTPEFLAAGVPVVSTAITDVVRPYRDLGLVEIAGTPEAMAAGIDRALDRPRQAWLRRVDGFLAGMSWDRTWSEMAVLLDGAEAPAPQPVPVRRPALATVTAGQANV